MQSISKLAEFEDATPLLADADALRKRLAEDGFLYFRGLIPRAEVLALREHILRICQKYGWIEGDPQLMDGILNPSAYAMEPFGGVGVTQPAYADIYRLESFHRMAHHPAIMGLMQALFGETVLVHPRHIARMMFPTKANAPTPPHQDYIHIQGTQSVYTCWMPLGDCPKSLGGLSVLRGSHHVGILPVRESAGAGGRAVVLGDADQEWYQGDHAAGDALVFHSLAVHKASPNQHPDRLRLSCDFRYQPLSLPIEQRSLLPHSDVLTWEEAYAGWPSDDLKYYWRRYELEFQEFDTSLLAYQKM